MSGYTATLASWIGYILKRTASLARPIDLVHYLIAMSLVSRKQLEIAVGARHVDLVSEPFAVTVDKQIVVARSHRGNPGMMSDVVIVYCARVC